MAVVQGSRWIGNENHGGSSSARGAGLDVVAVDSSSLDIFASKFNSNSNVSDESTTVGGGLNLNFEDNSVFSIRQSEVRGNRHTNLAGQSTGTGLFIGMGNNAAGEFVDNEILENDSAGEGGDVGSGGAIWLQDEATVVIERTEWRSNTSDGFPAQLSLVVQDSSSMVFRDSLVADGSSEGIGTFADDPGAEMRLVNITVADHSSGALFIFGPGTKSVYNSIFFNNGDGPSFQKGTDIGNNLIDADPFFIDPGGRDYRLSPGSPAVDRGNNLPPGVLGTLDLDRDARVEGPAVDIGAYELASQDGVTQYLTQIGNGRAGDIVLQTEIDLAAWRACPPASAWSSSTRTATPGCWISPMAPAALSRPADPCRRFPEAWEPGRL